MDMKIIGSKVQLCPCCMQEHTVKTVAVREQATFKDVHVEYDAEYQYCDIADELWMNERQMSENDTKMKDAFRKKTGFLTSSQIRATRTKYSISQSDLCVLLGWGEKTIARYERHQVQSKANDTILRKISDDPEWFLSLLNAAKDCISDDAYQRCRSSARKLYEKEQDAYLKRAIAANNARFYEKYTEKALQDANRYKIADSVQI